MLTSNSRPSVTFGWKKKQNLNQIHPVLDLVQSDVAPIQSTASSQYSSSVSAASTESPIAPDPDVDLDMRLDSSRNELEFRQPEFALPHPDPRRCREVLRATARCAPLDRPRGQPTALADMFAPDSEEPFELAPDADAEFDERSEPHCGTSLTDRLEKLRDAGVRLAEAHKYRAALERFQRALRLIPRCAHLRSATAANSDGDVQMDCADATRAACTECERAESSSPPAECGACASAAALWEMSAQLYLELDRCAEAVRCAEDAVRAAPRWWAARQTLGRALLSLGDAQLALREFSVAVHLFPGDRALWCDDLWWAASLVREQRRVVREAAEATNAAPDEGEMLAELDCELERRGVSGPRRRVLLQPRAPGSLAASNPSRIAEPSREELADAQIDSLADFIDSLVLMRL